MGLIGGVRNLAGVRSLLPVALGAAGVERIAHEQFFEREAVIRGETHADS
jgi:hypothetical protein